MTVDFEESRPFAVFHNFNIELNFKTCCGCLWIETYLVVDYAPLMWAYSVLILEHRRRLFWSGVGVSRFCDWTDGEDRAAIMKDRLSNTDGTSVYCQTDVGILKFHFKLCRRLFAIHSSKDSSFLFLVVEIFQSSDISDVSLSCRPVLVCISTLH